MSIQVGAITIDGIALNNSLQWTNRFQWSAAQQNIRRTLQGTQTIYQQQVVAGQPIVLEARQETGWLQKSMVDSLLALAEIPESNRVFVFHGESYTVRFLYENSQSPVAFVPLRSVQVIPAEEWMIGKIKLITV